MSALVFSMTLALLLALAVLALVLVPARRDGREVLTPHGEDVVQRVKSGTESAANRGGELVSSAVSGAARVIPGDRKN